MAKAVKLTRSQMYALAGHATFAEEGTVAIVAEGGKTTVAWKPKPKTNIDTGRPLPDSPGVQSNGYIYHTIDQEGRLTLLKNGPE